MLGLCRVYPEIYIPTAQVNCRFEIFRLQAILCLVGALIGEFWDMPFSLSRSRLPDCNAHIEHVFIFWLKIVIGKIISFSVYVS